MKRCVADTRPRENSIIHQAATSSTQEKKQKENQASHSSERAVDVCKIARQRTFRLPTTPNLQNPRETPGAGWFCSADDTSQATSGFRGRLDFGSGQALATGTAWAGLCLIHLHHAGSAPPPDPPTCRCALPASQCAGVSRHH